MQSTSALIHQEFTSQRTFDAVVTAFEEVVGAGDGKSFQSIVKQTTSAETFTERIRTAEGSSGFMFFLKVDRWIRQYATSEFRCIPRGARAGDPRFVTGFREEYPQSGGRTSAEEERETVFRGIALSIRAQESAWKRPGR